MMQFLKNIKLIQGGMGIYVSNWRLARAVASERPGQTAGTVSGVALDIVYTRKLQLGDPGGHTRRALAAFDDRFDVSIGRKICDRYFIPGGKAPDKPFKLSPMNVIHRENGSNEFPLPNGDAGPVTLKLDEEVIELLIATGFIEVWLAREGHDGSIFINFLRKVELPLVYAMYGAMLAEVDGIVVGAGNPDGLPAIRSQLVNHHEVITKPSILYREPGEEFVIPFDPKLLADGKFSKKPLKKPAFLSIVTQEDQVKALAESTSEPPDGFIIENHTAGGHNANPVLGTIKRDVYNQLVYGEKDKANHDMIRDIGLPFWLAGGYSSNTKLQEALQAGATGVQVGSVFALTEESGMRSDFRSAILNAIKNGAENIDLVRTTMFSSTGFSFKVVQLKKTVSDKFVYEARRRICDLGLLQQRGLTKPNNGVRKLFSRCPAGPVDYFISKRGLKRNTEDRRCLCNGLLACVGLGQAIKDLRGKLAEEPAIVTLGEQLEAIRRMSRQGQTTYWTQDVIADILG